MTFSNSRIYFSRYFYSIFRRSNNYSLFSRSKLINSSNIFLYSDPYHHARSANSLGHATYDLASGIFIRSPSTKYFFPVGFFYSYNGFQDFYSFYWRFYANNDEVFKNLVVILLKLNLMSSFPLNMNFKLFLNVLLKKNNLTYGYFFAAGKNNSYSEKT